MGGVRDAVTAAYPGGLPEWEPTRPALDGTLDEVRSALLSQGGGGLALIDARDASLWTCGKEFQRGKLVSERLGSCNEKTKVVAKLAPRGEGAPAREAMVSESEREAMSAYYFKRQEELRRLAEADEDDYLNSAWADPKGMKRSLQGLDDVKAPGLRFG